MTDGVLYCPRCNLPATRGPRDPLTGEPGPLVCTVAYDACGYVEGVDDVFVHDEDCPCRDVAVSALECTCDELKDTVEPPEITAIRRRLAKRARTSPFLSFEQRGELTAEAWRERLGLRL